MTRYMGIDYGASRIGISLTDPLKMIATDYSVIKNISEEDSIEEIKEICREKKVELIVVGLPLNMDGSQGFQAEEVLEFVEALKKLEISIVLNDERLSTKIAEEIMDELKVSLETKRKMSDAKAASVILQDYIDYN